MDDTERHSPEYYREKAAEIRRFARPPQLDNIAGRSDYFAERRGFLCVVDMQ